MPDLSVDGEWRGAPDERTRGIRCPADGSPVGVVGMVDEAGGKDAVEAVAARRAFGTGPRPAPPPPNAGGPSSPRSSWAG
ncbi:hypothetical protein SUDANB58_00785 [Streptomyces sp. enrichment culture]|uniref:hypothetical protein n=1 Tax=Streptomyces sp. enrichment culture TaxID=1795815 RepID=UPI003F56A410